MLIDYQLSQTSIVLRVKVRDTTSGNGKTGLATSSGGNITTSGLIIAAIADVEASTTAYTVAATHVQTIATLGTFAAPTSSCCRWGEVDSTNHKGIYELQLDNSRYAVSSAKSLTVSISGVSGMFDCDVVIPLRATNPYDGVHGGMSALPNAAAAASGGLPTVGTGSGQISVTDGFVQLAEQPIVRTGTAQGGASASITLDSGASSSNSFYNGMVVSIVSGTGSSPVQTNLITAYVGSTKVATLANNWTTNPDNTSVFIVSLLPLANLLQWFWGTQSAVDSNGFPNVAVADWKNATAPAMTGDAYARLGAPAGGSVSADIAAVKGVLPTALTGAGNIKADALAVNGVATSSVTAVNANVGTTQPTNFTGTGGSALVQSDVTDWKASAAPAMTGDAFARLGAPAGGSVSADIAAVKLDTAHLSNECISNSIASGTPLVGSFIGNTGLSSTDNFYSGSMLAFTSGANKGIARAISSYTGSTKTFSFTGATGAIDAPFPTAPSVADTFDILGRAASGT